MIEREGDRALERVDSRGSRGERNSQDRLLV